MTRAATGRIAWKPCTEHGGRHLYARLGRTYLRVEALSTIDMFEARVCDGEWTAQRYCKTQLAARRACVKLARAMTAKGRR